jgi:hypothetical protein
VTDRVRVAWASSDAAVARALEAHAAAIAAEVLALELKRDPAAESAGVLAGRPVSYSLSRV